MKSTKRIVYLALLIMAVLPKPSRPVREAQEPRSGAAPLRQAQQGRGQEQVYTPA